MPSNNPLPPKEKALFNRIVKCYEQKQYKNGFKFARQILSNPKFSEHGETLAMKGLTMNCLGRKEEAYELVKRGLTNDIRSHVCWHVYGLLQRSDKKYDEAIKCYRNALKWDPENLHILRDLSMLQIHMRDMEGHRQTKYTLLQLKPAQRAPWIGYAISNHLLQDYDTAFKILDEFRKTQQSEDAKYEYSELLLYQNLILRQDGKFAQALEHLKENEAKILDKCAVDEVKGDLCLQLNDLKSAEEIFVALIDRNPENLKYYERLECVLNPQTCEERLEIYDAMVERHKRADAPRFLPLRFLHNSPVFHERLDKFMRAQMKRGVPPLLITLKQLYDDKSKVEVITSLASAYVHNLKQYSKFHPDDEEEQQPTTLLWALSFYGQHLDHIGRSQQSLDVLDEAIAHTPTLIELHVARAKTLKHLGDMEGAVRSMDEAQSLDTADRFINCKCVRYMIRNDRLQEAATIAAKFTRENVSVDEYAKEMQCMWYELEVAQAHKRAGRLGEALAKCHHIDKHFHEITQDQLEFHQYCIRKTTLKAYTRLLKLEDQLRQHDFYLQAARIAIQVYVQLHDEPYQAGEDNINTNEANLSSAELKKLRNKQRKAERKKAAAAAEKKKQEQDRINKRKPQAQKQEEGSGEKKKEDEFLPELLVSTSKPIEEARKFLIPLQQHQPTCFETHYFDFLISQRRNKPLMMLRALLRCIAFSSDQHQQAQTHLCKIIFLHKVANSKFEESVVDDIIKRHVTKLLPAGYDVTMTSKLNDEFIAQNSNSLPHLFAGARAMYHLDEKRQEESLKLLTDFDPNKTSDVTIKTCVEIVESMSRGKCLGSIDDERRNNLINKFARIFPRANAFGYRDVTQTSGDEDGDVIKQANGQE